MRFFALLLLAAYGVAASAAAAGTETFTPTMTGTATHTATASPTLTASPTFTVSPTPTPGPGAWSLSMTNPLVYQGTGHTATWTYTASQAFSNGLLAFHLPDGLEAPDADNFYVEYSQDALVSGSSFSGQAVSFTVNNLAAGANLVFLYGYQSGGFSVSTTITPLGPFQVYAHPTSLTLPAAPVTPNPAPASIAVVLKTATPTLTATPTITATFTSTPTITETRTITQTFTETPVAPAPVSGVFAYPNPFDLRRFDKVTFRFQPTASAGIQVFNLVGEPVRTLDAADVFPGLGWALWHGEDDYRRKVTGGIYFVRVKTADGVLTRKFTVLN